MKRKLSLVAMAMVLFAGTVGYLAAQDWGYDRDGNRYYDNDGYRNSGIEAAHEFGFRDGQEAGRGDLWSAKPFNPNPRGRFDGADHGYRREFGSKHEYRERYAQAYREGYDRAYNNGRNYRRGW
jgi:hypothetical protein